MIGPKPSASVLVLKHGALGDFFFALGAMKKIADFHAADEITLLTTAPYAEIAEQTGYFDHVLIDERPPLWAFSQLYTLYKWAKSQKFKKVYDLQNVTRTRAYMWTLFSRAAWNGEIRSAAFPYTPPFRKAIHQIERKRQQLACAGLPEAPDPDLSFLQADLEEFQLKGPYFLLVPGSSSGASFKRWPAQHYGRIAQKLLRHNVMPVIIGGSLEAGEACAIQALCPEALNLCGKTSLGQLASLGRTARGVLGNDTGPFHILWLAGCPALGLFCGRSDPENCGPLGAGAHVIQENLIQDISPEKVWELLKIKYL